MTSDKLENICKLLSEHNFDTNENVPDEFKCGKCRKILIVACQTRCGCRFCRSCVDEMMNNGCQFCPGITNDCKIELLSSVQLDYIANNQISKLIMKCPEEMCSYECELSEMSEHLRICGKKSVECPFYKLGCDIKKITNDKLIEHFQLENYNHNKTLIGMIDNIKNEIEVLREKELRNHEEINKLKTDLESKDEHLKLINAEVELMKVEKLEMVKQMENIEKTLNDDITELKLKHEKEMQSIKTEKEELDDHIQIGLRNIWYKIDDIELEFKKLSENNKIESIKLELIEKIEILQTNFYNKIDEIEFTQKEMRLINDEIHMKIKEMKEELLKENDKSTNNLANEINAKFNETFCKIKSIDDEIRTEIIEVCEQAIDKSILQMSIEQRINQLERINENKLNGIFEWMIDKVDKLRNKYLIWSEYFHARMNSYKLRLHICQFGDELWISLCIWDDVINQDLPFPFTADVTIKTVNKNKREVSSSVKKHFLIEKPENNSFNESDAFIYSKSELTKSGILESNCFIIQCCVELKEL